MPRMVWETHASLYKSLLWARFTMLISPPPLIQLHADWEDRITEWNSDRQRGQIEIRYLKSKHMNVGARRAVRGEAVTVSNRWPPTRHSLSSFSRHLFVFDSNKFSWSNCTKFKVNMGHTWSALLVHKLIANQRVTDAFLTLFPNFKLFRHFKTRHLYSTNIIRFSVLRISKFIINSHFFLLQVLQDIWTFLGLYLMYM